MTTLRSLPPVHRTPWKETRRPGPRVLSDAEIKSIVASVRKEQHEKAFWKLTALWMLIVGIVLVLIAFGLSATGQAWMAWMDGVAR